MTTVGVVLLDPTLPLPVVAKPGDAGVDLRAREATVIAPHGRALVPTGIAIALPQGFAGFVLPRSGLALNHGITCLNAPGLIDAGYRGEIAVILHNTDSAEAFTVQKGDRIAQLVIQQVESADFVQVEVLDATERGVGGFGHSGRN
ncbi:MAG: dUTP diphosphatase [Actinomycetes bacterium]